MRIRRCIAQLAVSAALCSATLWQASGGPPNTDYITPPFTFSPLAQVIGAIAVVISLFCPAPNEQPPANASFRGLGWLPVISFCVARDDSFSLVSLPSASRANRLPPFELLELYVGPVTPWGGAMPAGLQNQLDASSFPPALGLRHVFRRSKGRSSSA